MAHLYFGYIVHCLNEEFNDQYLAIVETKKSGKLVAVYFWQRYALNNRKLDRQKVILCKTAQQQRRLSTTFILASLGRIESYLHNVLLTCEGTY